MRIQRVLLGVLTLAANTTLLIETAHADRRTGLGGNLLITDPDDVFPFPQHSVSHRNMVRLDYGATSSSGNGVLTLGDKQQAYGISLHRGDLLNPNIVGYNTELAYLAGVQNPFAQPGGGSAFAVPATNNSLVSGGPVAPATVVDLMYGRAIGENLIGARFGFGRGVQAANVDGETQKAQQSFFVGQLGYSLLPPQGLRLDLAGNVVVAIGSSSAIDAAGKEQPVNKGQDFRGGVLARAYYPLNNLVDIGILGNVSVDNQHVKANGGPKQNMFNLGVMAGIGPSIHLDRAKIAAYGGFTMGAGKVEPNSQVKHDEVSSNNFAVPMVNMAAEVQLLDWLYVRTGTQYSWNLAHQKDYDTNDQKVKSRASAGDFKWTAGMGVVKGMFAFDGVVQNAFVTGGPNFIGGTSPGFLAIAQLTYKFGDVFSTGQGTNLPASPYESAPFGSAPDTQAAASEPAAPAQETAVAAPIASDATGSAEATGATASGSVSGEVSGTVSAPTTP